MPDVGATSETAARGDGSDLPPPGRGARSRAPRGRSESGLPALRWYHFLIFAIAYLYAFPYFDRLRNANEMPRILQTRAIVDRGVLHIDAGMGELQSVMDTSIAPNGHRYPNKAPGPSFVGIPAYAFCKLLGIKSLRTQTWFFRVTVATIPALLFLPLFYRVSRRFTDNEVSRRVALVALALASQAFPYALLFMSHMLATVFVGLAFAFAIPLARGSTRHARRDALLVGFGCATSVMMDYQASMAAAIIGLYVVLLGPRRLRNGAWVAAGALVPTAILAGYHQAAFGSLVKTGYSFGVDRSTMSGFMGIIGFGKEALRSTFILPANGLLILAPWVILALVGGAAIASGREWRKRVGPEAVVCGLVAIAYLAFLSSLLPYMARGGWCVGPRYMTLAMPFLAWLAGAGFAVARRFWVTKVLALALVLASVVVFVVGATTFPHWPDRLANPLYDLIFPLLGRGYAVHSLGTALGLSGIYAILPLYLFLLVAVLWLFGLLERRRLVTLAVVCSLAALIVLGHRAFPMTNQNVVNPWPMIHTIWEPRR
jgi:hypothetical protein